MQGGKERRRERWKERGGGGLGPSVLKQWTPYPIPHLVTNTSVPPEMSLDLH